jgi:hypothetical protein
MKHLTEIIRFLSSHKMYVYYSLAYGLSTLIIPLGVQFLVNNLALSGIWLNITAFIIFITLGLVVAQSIKHSQLIIAESLEREIFCKEIERWKDLKRKEYSHYYFEVLNLLKSFSKSYSNIIEIALVMFFGLSTIIVFHPAFLTLAVIIILTVLHIYVSSRSAIDSSIKESNEKYHLFRKINSTEGIKDSDIFSFLKARDNHFNFIRKNSFKIGSLVVAVQAVLLSLGCYLIKINQLSVGQLVSAEIIVSGIFIPLSKLPLILEAIYDYEASKFKISMALTGNSNE